MQVNTFFDDKSNYGSDTAILLMFGHDDEVLPYYLKKHPEVRVVVMANDGMDRATSIDLLIDDSDWNAMETHQGSEMHFQIYVRK
jgi:hypothetical protein